MTLAGSPSEPRESHPEGVSPRDPALESPNRIEPAIPRFAQDDGDGAGKVRSLERVSSRMRSRILLAAALVIPALSLSGSPSARPRPKPTAANACVSCTERRPTLDPRQFAKGFEPEVQAGYEIARRIPATLDSLHCFCECAESPMFRHKTLLTCFTDRHAAGCGICLSEARLAARLKERGLSDAEIKVTVESVHRTDGHPRT